MPDLTQEERDECVEEYLDIFRKSNGGALAEVYFRVLLKKIGMDADEIDYLVRIYRP